MESTECVPSACPWDVDGLSMDARSESKDALAWLCLEVCFGGDCGVMDANKESSGDCA